LLTIRTREPGASGREPIEVRRDHIIVSPAANLASQVVDDDPELFTLRFLGKGGQGRRRVE